MIGTIDDLLEPGDEVLSAWGDFYGVLAARCIEREEELYTQTERKTGGWRGERKFILSEKRVQSQTITQFTFTSEDGLPVCSYGPGQYTTVWSQPTDCEYKQPRHYSIVGGSNNSLSIAVKREPRGLVSGYLHDRIAEGDTLSLSPPFGHFNMGNAQDLWLSDESHPLVLISAGIGLTPAMSILASLKMHSRSVGTRRRRRMT